MLRMMLQSVFIPLKIDFTQFYAHCYTVCPGRNNLSSLLEVHQIWNSWPTWAPFFFSRDQEMLQRRMSGSRACKQTVRLTAFHTPSGDNSRPIPRPTERLHHPVPGPHQDGRPPEGRAPIGRRHVACSARALRAGTCRLVPELFRVAARL